MDTKQFLVGSKYFFNKYEDFHSKDTDYLIIEQYPKNYKIKCHTTGNNVCYFKWRKLSPKLFLYHAKYTTLPMEAGKFLVKEFANYIGLTIEQLKELETVFNNLDSKHTYLKVIYDSYIENKGFYLTEAQRLKAYKEYKKYRDIKD